MVQRKLPNNKLGIQADHHVKSEKPLGSLKPSSCQHLQETAGKKNKGTDLKKIMKKSSSSLPLRKTFAQPGKPPPDAAAETPQSQKKPMNKAAAIYGSSPNYMKSTSCSEAKKEVSHQVSTSRRRSASTASKTSSGLKLVRTLTKSPSFKPAKKCSKVAALCSTDINVEKTTCSSTLKDSKFPAFLMLNPGGTESQGTSIIKVCPYSYCSLNGHHHNPSPPLKCFLKARRRSLKTQRSMKMEANNLRQRRVKVNPSAGDVRPEEFNEEEPIESNAVDLGKSPMDFFIEIYARSKGMDVEENRGNETEAEHDTEKPVSETLSEGSPRSEIDLDENLEHCGEITEALHEEVKHNNVDEEFRRILVKEEESPCGFTDVDDDKQEAGISRVDVVDQTVFDVIDIEWGEEWQFYASEEPDSQANSSMESDSNIGDSSEFHRIDLLDEFVTSTSDESDTCNQVSETLCYDQVSSAEEMFEVSVAMEDTETGKEKMVENGVIGTVDEVSKADSPPPDVYENNCSIDLKEETFDKLEQEETNIGDSEADDETEKELPSGEMLIIGIQGSSHDVLQVADEDDNINEVQGNQNKQLSEVINAIDDSFPSLCDHISDGQHDNQCVLDEANKFKVPTSMDSEEQNNSRMHQTGLSEGSEEVREMELEDKTWHKPRSELSFTRGNAKGEVSDDHNNIKWRIGRKRQEEKYEEGREFNPREPNFLPVVPEPDAEKVDLRHQMMDERKHSEEWMLDHALQQAVTKLAPARKRKVALLVEAFETVLPVTQSRQSSTGFAHERAYSSL